MPGWEQLIEWLKRKHPNAKTAFLPFYGKNQVNPVASILATCNNQRENQDPGLPRRSLRCQHAASRCGFSVRSGLSTRLHSFVSKGGVLH